MILLPPRKVGWETFQLLTLVNLHDSSWPEGSIDELIEADAFSLRSLTLPFKSRKKTADAMLNAEHEVG